MNTQTGRRSLGMYLPLSAVLLLLASAAISSQADSTLPAEDGRYRSSGQVLLGDGSITAISQSLVLEKDRFQSLTRSSAVTIEVTGRVERTAFGRIRLLVDERHVSGLNEEEIDDELAFNLLYGRHRTSQVNLKPLGGCLYGIETRKIYCRDDHQLPANP